VKHIYFFIIIRADEQENYEILEGQLIKFAIGIELLLQFGLGFLDGVKDGLMGFCSVKNHLFVDEVLNHILPILNFQFFQPFFA